MKDIRFETPTFIDPLTGLFNQYYLRHFLPEEIKKAELGNYSLAALMIDLDGFKKINDTYGHLSGDEVLKQLSAVMKKYVRTTDMLIRYAGDEFMILLPGAGSDKVKELAVRLVDEVNNAVFTAHTGESLKLTLSIGFAVYPEDAKQALELVNLADKALYFSKQKGKNAAFSYKEVRLDEVSLLLATDLFPSKKFIDREDVVEKIIQAQSACFSGGTQAVFISGGIGMGRSRLLRELNGLFKEKTEVLSGVATYEHIKDAYYVLSAAISAYIEEKGLDFPQLKQAISQIPLAELSELSLLVPQLSGIVKKPQELDSANTQRRGFLFKAFLSFFYQLSRNAPFVLMLDDINCIDEASFKVICYMLTQGKNNPICIIGAYTLEGTASRLEDANTVEAIEAFSRFENVLLLNLAKFSLQDTAKFIESIFPAIGVNQQVVQVIFDITGGHPAFLEETLRSLVENRLIYYQDDRWQVKKEFGTRDIPRSFDELVKNKLKSLDEETKEVIIQAAVMGKEFKGDILGKIESKNRGFISELMGRAKRMNLIKEAERAGEFSFSNSNIQSALYKELGQADRQKIHYKIAKTLSENNKDNLYNVAGELAYHFGQAPQEKESLDFNRMLLKKTKDLFDPQEIADYLGDIAGDIVKPDKKFGLELDENLMKQAIQFIRLIQGTIKKIKLYPPRSRIRLDISKEIQNVLAKLLEARDSIDLSETEKSLFVNGRRLSLREAEEAMADYILAVLLEHNIKTISFLRGVTEEELSGFMQNLSQSREFIIKGGGWQRVIEDSEIRHISIEEVGISGGAEISPKSREVNKLEKAMLMEFLLGKIGNEGLDSEGVIADLVQDPGKIAGAINEAVKAKTGGSTDQGFQVKMVSEAIERLDVQVPRTDHRRQGYVDNLARVVLALEPVLRNKLIRSRDFIKHHQAVFGKLMESLSNEDITAVVMDEARDHQQDPLLLKDFINGFIENDEKKKDILSHMGPQLASLRYSQEEIDFIKGDKQWEDIPANNRLNIVMNMLKNKELLIGPDKIKGLLEDLGYPPDSQQMKDAFVALFNNMQELDSKKRKEFAGAVGDFVKQPLSDKEKSSESFARIDIILEQLGKETDVKTLSGLLEILKSLIAGFMDSLPDSANIIAEFEASCNREQIALFINKIFYAIYKSYNTDSRHVPGFLEVMDNFIMEIGTKNFLSLLIYNAINGDMTSEDKITEIFARKKDIIIQVLLGLATESSTVVRDPFKEYVIKKRIAQALTGIGEASFQQIKQLLSQDRDNTAPVLIEFVGYIKDERIVELISPFLSSTDPELRRAAVMALSEIGLQSCLELISEFTEKEKGGHLKALAGERLGLLKAKLSKRKS